MISLEADHKAKIKKLIADAKKMDATNPRLYLVEGDELLKAGNKKEAAKNYKLASDGLKANKSEEFLKPTLGHLRSKAINGKNAIIVKD